MTGIRGIIVFCLILLIFFGWYIKANSMLTKEAIIETIDPWVKGNVTRRVLPDIESAAGRNNKEAIERLTKSITNIDYNSITVKGFWEPLVVRSEITLNGEVPSDGSGVRYFYVEYDKILNRWVCGGGDLTTNCETNEFAYRNRFIVRKRW